MSDASRTRKHSKQTDTGKSRPGGHLRAIGRVKRKPAAESSMKELRASFDEARKQFEERSKKYLLLPSEVTLFREQLNKIESFLHRNEENRGSTGEKSTTSRSYLSSIFHSALSSEKTSRELESLTEEDKENLNRYLSQLHLIEKTMRVSSSSRVPVYHVFRVAHFQVLPRQKVEPVKELSKVSDIYTRRGLDPVESMNQSNKRFWNDLCRKSYSGIADDLVRTAKLAMSIHEYLDINDEDLECKGIADIFDIVCDALSNVAYFMYLYPLEQKRASMAIKSVKHLVEGLDIACSKHKCGALDIKDFLQRLHQSTDFKPVKSVLADIDDMSKDDERPVMEDVGAANLRSKLSGLGLLVVDAPFLDNLSKIPAGNGGYGDAFRVSVYEDKIKKDGSASKKVDVVIKTYKENGLEITNFKRMYREIRVWAHANNHDNILKLHACWIVNGFHPVLVSPYCNGGTFFSFVRTTPKPESTRVYELLRNVADGLKHLHSQTNSGPIVHGDLKSDNILIHDGRALLCDFGLSVMVNDERGLTSLNHGNEQLVAPEIYTAMKEMEHIPLTTAMDVYSFGCLIFEGETGAYPFNQVPMEKIHTTPIRSYKSIIPTSTEIPENIWTFILRCWDEAPFRPLIDEIVEFTCNYTSQDVDMVYL